MVTTSTINAVSSNQGGKPLTIGSAFNQAIKSTSATLRRFIANVRLKEVSRMKKLFYIFLLAFGCISCSDNSQYKEVVLKRYSGGEKKVVTFYEGDGANEVLVKRLTYDQHGELQLQEDLLNNTKLNWLQLHPDLQTASGLKNYLQGEWINEGVTDRGEYTEKDGKTIYSIRGSDFSHHSIGKFKKFGEGWDTIMTATIKYENDYFLSLIDIKRDGEPLEPEETKDNRVQLKIISMDIHYFDGDDESALFKKVIK